MNIAIFYSLMFCLISITVLLIGYGSFLFLLGLWSRCWPSVPGVIESSTLEIGTNADRLKAYWVGVKYTYHWDTARCGSWIGFAYPGTASNSKLTRSKVETLHAALAPGTQVDVFVCPRLPAIAVLRTGHHWAALGYIAISSVPAGLPLWIAWLKWPG